MFIELAFQCMILYNKGNMLSWALSLRYTVSEKITLTHVEQKDIYFEGLSTPGNENNTNNKNIILQLQCIKKLWFEWESMR